MAKKKKSEPIVGIGKDPEALLVQKSRPLFGLWRSEYTLASFKIMDAYLARINSKMPDKRTVRFEKGEIEKLLGVTQIKKPDLKNRLKNLQQPVDLAKGNNNKIHSVTLFEEAEADQDDDGIWQVTLTCTQSAMKYFFNIEDIGYLRYRLRSVINITSRYSYIMFTYLESNRYRKSWEVDLEELKEILNCNDDELYKEFKFFNQRILKRCHKELTEKTELRYMYEPVKKGRKVVAINFFVATIKDLYQKDENQIEGQMNLEDFITNHNQEIWNETVKDFELTPEELEEIQSLLSVLPDYKLPELAHGTIHTRRYHYIDIKAREIRRRNSKEAIKNKFSYLLKMIKNDIED